MPAKVTKNFYYIGKWYFPGDEVSGNALKAAKKHGAVPDEDEKSQKEAPENKSQGSAEEQK